jgi:hypothetical protein
VMRCDAYETRNGDCVPSSLSPFLSNVSRFAASADDSGTGGRVTVTVLKETETFHLTSAGQFVLPRTAYPSPPPTVGNRISANVGYVGFDSTSSVDRDVSVTLDHYRYYEKFASRPWGASGCNNGTVAARFIQTSGDTAVLRLKPVHFGKCSIEVEADPDAGLPLAKPTQIDVVVGALSWLPNKTLSSYGVSFGSPSSLPKLVRAYRPPYDEPLSPRVIDQSSTCARVTSLGTSLEVFPTRPGDCTIRVGDALSKGPEHALTLVAHVMGALSFDRNGDKQSLKVSFSSAQGSPVVASLFRRYAASPVEAGIRESSCSAVAGFKVTRSDGPSSSGEHVAVTSLEIRPVRKGTCVATIGDQVDEEERPVKIVVNVASSKPQASDRVASVFPRN